mmetsp:Transcript_3493/g.9310  ORF Transcript_3493/g.9310 Transcript_3493/m.9310 type:complete len:224 (-) Transcript_3493:749-1420(-)
MTSGCRVTGDGVAASGTSNCTDAARSTALPPALLCTPLLLLLEGVVPSLLLAPGLGPTAACSGSMLCMSCSTSAASASSISSSMLPLPAVAAACAAAVLRLLLLQGAASALPPAAAAAAAEVSCAVRWPRGEWGAMPGSPLSVYESDAEAEGRGDPRPSSPITRSASSASSSTSYAQSLESTALPLLRRGRPPSAPLCPDPRAIRSSPTASGGGNTYTGGSKG